MDPICIETLEPQEVPVTIAGEKYILREATHETIRRVRNAVVASTKLDDKGKPVSIAAAGDADSLLVSMCLFKPVGAGFESTPLATVRGWPDRVVKKLADAVRQISDMDDDAAKKPQKAGTES